MAIRDQGRDVRLGFPLSGCKDFYVVAVSGVFGTVTVRCPNSDCASEAAASLTKSQK
jgi:hypothetical protein